MKTERLTVDPLHPSPRALARAAEVLRAGGLVAFPTETVYGLGALADDAAAVRRIFAAKGRPGTNPLIVHVPDSATARTLSTRWTAAAEALAAAFWPGALTLVVARDPERVPAVVAAGGPTVALRAPAHPVARALLCAVGRPLAAPSANRSQALSPTTADHVLKSLDGRIELVLDGGTCPYGIESTVVDASAQPPVVLRPGALPLEALAAVTPVRAREPLGAGDPGAALPSPGMLRRHYAPTARLVVTPKEALSACVQRLRASLGDPVGAVTRSPMAALLALQRVLPDAPGDYAARLFATLHELDDAGCHAIAVEAVPEDATWDAVRDRLARASAD